MTRGIRTTLALAVVLASTSLLAQEQPDKARVEKVDGYAEFCLGECIVADAQRVCPAPGLRFKGEGEAKGFGSVPLGYELKAEGTRRADGTLLARKVEARPNGSALFEGDIRSATNQAEAQARAKGRFVEGEGKNETSVGRLIEEGPQVDRVRRIVDTLLPPYLHPEDVRIYVIENKEWNAFAMGNYSIYVFTGLLDDMDDDEVAIVLGHELVHATHEHSRKQFKRDMWIQNYPEGPKADARQARRPEAPVRTVTAAATPAVVPAGAQALTAAPPPEAPSVPAATERREIKAGMTVDEVRRLLGDPQAEVIFAGKTQWTYPALTVVFANGKVTDVRF